MAVSRKASVVAEYIAIGAISAILAFNPLTTKYLLGLSNGWQILPFAFDVHAACIFVFAVWYLRTGKSLAFWSALTLLVVLIPTMLAVEIAIYHYAFTAPPSNTVENMHRLDNVLGWEPIPLALGRHVSAGNFDVIYRFDDVGRNEIAQNPGVTRTVHVFGDSFAFGSGVTNADTALSLFAERVRDRLNVQYYAVQGYGLEQQQI